MNVDSKEEMTKREYVEIMKYQFDEDEFDQKDFRKWQGERKILPIDEIVIEKKQDPYDESTFRYLVKLCIPKDSKQYQ